MRSSGKITVHRYQADQAAEWEAFHKTSGNGTIFHDLDFLAYHPPDRFDVHHLIFRRNGELIALLPAAIVIEPSGQRFMKSPYGASVGGFILPCGMGIAATLGIINQLKAYVSGLDLDGIEMRIGPNVYDEFPNDNLSFALAASGFSLTLRWLSHMVPLPPERGEVLGRIRSSRRSRYVRSALRKGVQGKAVGAEHLSVFYRILEANRAKHGARPTHTLSDLERIFKLVPDQVRLFVCEREGEIMTGCLVFELNSRVAYTFYICHDDRFEQYRPATLVTLSAAEYYAGRGFKYLDLGPSTFDDYSLNRGLARFKEEMGAVGFCRDTWRWERREGGRTR